MDSLLVCAGADVGVGAAAAAGWSLGTDTRAGAVVTGSWHCFFATTAFSSKMATSRDLLRPEGDFIGLLRGEPSNADLLCSFGPGDIAFTFASRGASARLLVGDEGSMVMMGLFCSRAGPCVPGLSCFFFFFIELESEAKENKGNDKVVMKGRIWVEVEVRVRVCVACVEELFSPN